MWKPKERNYAQFETNSAHRRTNKKWKLRNLATVFFFVLIAIVSVAAVAHSQTPTAAELPPGPMQAKATTSCLECHEARIILQQRLSKPAWTKEVDKMIKWGAVVDPADHDALIDYLSTNFNVDKPAYVADVTSTVKTKK
jgi:hypothetical protein